MAQPIPLDLLSLVNFVDPPQQRGTGILRGLRHGTSETANQAHPMGNVETDSRVVYPCTIHHNGRMGGLYTLYAESAAARVEWLQKLQEATGLRSVVQESNKVSGSFRVSHFTDGVAGLRNRAFEFGYLPGPKYHRQPAAIVERGQPVYWQSYLLRAFLSVAAHLVLLV